MPECFVRLVPFDRKYLDHSWHWLNDPEIKGPTMTPDFTREDQEAFFETLPQRENYHIWGIESIEGEPLGAVGLKHVAGVRAEFWCYIGERSWWGRGIGGDALRLSEVEARKLGLKELTMVATSDNSRSLNAYRRAGFVDDSQSPANLVSLTKQLER